MIVVLTMFCHVVVIEGRCVFESDHVPIVAYRVLDVLQCAFLLSSSTVKDP